MTITSDDDYYKQATATAGSDDDTCTQIVVCVFFPISSTSSTPSVVRLPLRESYGTGAT